VRSMTKHGAGLEIICKRKRLPTTRRSKPTGAVLWGLAWTFVVCVLLRLGAVQAFAQETRTTGCLAAGQIFHNPRELPSADGILKGTIVLKEEMQALPESRGGSQVTCAEGVRVRNFRGETAAGKPLDRIPAHQPHATLSDPEPGPTLRARIGDLVQLTFVNEVNPNNFDPNIDFKCTEVGQDGSRYPKQFGDESAFPNCLHASSTANIHFHGTHTNPNSTGDNVYLQVRPLPRDNQGNLTTTRADATVGLAEFFRRCTEELQNPLNSWPATWRDLPKAWTDKQKELLLTHQQKYSNQRLWDQNLQRLQDGWPIYYIGAFPYCFALPPYEGPSGARPIMGQVPGTHWYHAHKHGSTAINVANGMTGAFIIEGKYDDDLNDAYRKYILEREGKKVAWNANSQPVLVLNQLATALNPTVVGGSSWSDLDFVVNGRVRPKLRMQPGEVQLWRILNTSSRSAAYFMPPAGIQWMQVAQDGVQLADENYKKSLNKPLYVAPANRIDLLVKAPKDPLITKVEIKNVTARDQVRHPTVTAVELLTVEVAGPPVTLIDGQTAQMDFLSMASALPKFLDDITEDELALNNKVTRTLVFNSNFPPSPKQHTINGIQFGEGHAEVRVLLGAVEEWKIVNSTKGMGGNPTGSIDHPLHIHINPFQVTEVFDPNEKLDESPGADPRYVFGVDPKDLKEGQCLLDLADPSSWKPCAKQMATRQRPWVWHDVYAIPSALAPVDKNGEPIRDAKGQPIIVPGYFKMRSRFVDYPGLYVMHCHILIHEDRGMMYSVEVVKANPTQVEHH
jgi:FtsP/CotA-like multicopper oxidase with cupredoxin domain